eukprot:scaffold28770_cov64-Phaeocystis_antarctica.AAC.3
MPATRCHRGCQTSSPRRSQTQRAPRPTLQLVTVGDPHPLCRLCKRAKFGRLHPAGSGQTSLRRPRHFPENPHASPDCTQRLAPHHALHHLRVPRPNGGGAEAAAGSDAEDAGHPAALECARCTATAAATRLVHHTRPEHRPDVLLRWNWPVPVGPAPG